MWIVLMALALSACSLNEPATEAPAPMVVSTDYLIGAGDQLQIFVWRNPELSVTVPVRPDGMISVPLLGDVRAGDYPRWPWHLILNRDSQCTYAHPRSR